MKIDGTKSSSDIKKKKSASKTSSGGGEFGAMMASQGSSGADASLGASMSSSIASVDVLLAAQSAEDPAQGKAKKRMVVRASSILDKLNDVKMSMLSNDINVGHLISIADVVATHREQIIDPEMSAILDEIDLRAHVELAKLQVAKSRL